MSSQKSSKNKKKSRTLIYKSENSHTDRVVTESEKFPLIEISGKRPETVIHLLGCKETEIILKCLHHLDKFAIKRPENIQILYENEIIGGLFNNDLWNHENCFIQRFSMKLISGLLSSKLKFTNEIIRKCLEFAKNYYLNGTDKFLIEYSSLVLLTLMDEPRIYCELEQDLNFIQNGVFKNLINTTDPDILNNSYKILLKFLSQGSSFLNICDLEDFPFERVVGDVRSDYVEIQKTALEILIELALCKNSFFVCRFTCPPVFRELFEVLENKLYQELHELILNLLKRLMNHEKVAKAFYLNEYLVRLFSFYRNSEQLQLQTQILGVFVELSKFPEICDVLHQLGFVAILSTYIEDVNSINQDVCTGTRRIMNHPESCLEILQNNPTIQLLNVLKTDSKDWLIRSAAAETLNVIFKRSLKSCEIALENNVSEILSNIFKRDYDEVPPDVLIHVTNMLNCFANNCETRNKIITPYLAHSFVIAIQNSYPSSTILSNLLNCASIFICEPILQDEFIEKKFCNIILHCLKSTLLLIKSGALNFIIITGKILKFSKEYINEGILDFLLENEITLSSCANWPPAIESILSTNLPLKFAIRGRLDITDVTGTDFHISKFDWKDYKIFKDILANEVSPLYPIILVNFEHSEYISELTVHIPKGHANEKDCTYCRRPHDPYLPKYLEKLENMLETRGLCEKNSVTKTIDITKIQDRVKLIAQVVCTEMCGTKPGQQSEICSESAVLSHLSCLKCSLHCNIIPLGSIRFGGPFERAVLFKCLSDQVGLPCTLQKSPDYRMFWNEIPIPIIESYEQCSVSMLPQRLLRVTHVVDLMENPGEIYQIGSLAARQYQKLL